MKTEKLTEKQKETRMIRLELSKNEIKNLPENERIIYLAYQYYIDIIKLMNNLEILIWKQPTIDLGKTIKHFKKINNIDKSYFGKHKKNFLKYYFNINL